MLKVIGAVLLLSASAGGFIIWIGTTRHINQRMRALANMLERIEGRIRWQDLSLLRSLQQELHDPIIGVYAEEIVKTTESGNTLQSSWSNIFRHLQPKEAAEILCSIDFLGDKQQIMGALHLAAHLLRQLANQTASQQGERERLGLAITFSFAGFLMIVLL